MPPETQSLSRSKALAALMSLLLLAGLASSVYLSHLYLEVRAAGGSTVDSFCAVSEGVNCVTVAASDYSRFLGIPIAFYGVQYYALALALVIASTARTLPIRKWDSVLFVLSTLSLPFCAILAWISAFKIHSVCILCAVIYGVNILAFMILGGLNLRRLREFVAEGPRELLGYARGARRFALLGVSVALLSQFLWLPRVLEAEARTTEPPARSTASGPVSSAALHGPWSSQPVSGLVFGPDDAPVRIEEFTDFECPFCSKAHRTMFDVLTRYPGKVRLVHRDFPLDDACNPSIPRTFHPHACRAAYMARCAGSFDRYWPFEAVLFEHQRELDAETLSALPARVGLDPAAMLTCADSPATRALVLQDIREGIERGVQGTPTFFVNGEKFVGALPPAFWEKKIAEILSR